MAAGAGGGAPALDFQTLPTVTLVGEAEEDQEVKILVFLVRCRESGFMGILPRAEMVAHLLAPWWTRIRKSLWLSSAPSL